MSRITFTAYDLYSISCECDIIYPVYDRNNYYIIAHIFIFKEEKEKKTKKQNDASGLWKRQTNLEFSIHKFLSKRKRKILHDFYVL